MQQPFYEIKKESKRNYGLLLSLIIGVLLLIVGEILSTLIQSLLTVLFPPIPWESLEAQLFFFFPLLFVVLLWAKLVEKSPWQGLGMTKKNVGKDFFVGYGIGAAMLSLSTLIMVVLGSAKIQGFHFTLDMLPRVILLIFAWIVQSSTEEILTRGWLFSSVAAKRSVTVGLIASSLFFTVMHIGNEGISIIPLLDLFLYGVLTALYMLKTNSIWGVCGIHAAWNFFQGSIFSFSVSGNNTDFSLVQISIQGPEWLSGGKFGVEGSIISVLIQAIFILWLICDLKQKNHLVKKTETDKNKKIAFMD